MKHNLAILLSKRADPGDEARALGLWREAYRESPDNPNIKKGLARHLVRHNMQADAARVLAGERLDEA